MQLITAVNLIMPKLGERPVTSLDTKHPTLAIILPVLEHQMREVLMRGWWFNTSRITLYPDSEGFIDKPQACLSFLPDGSLNVVVRGERMYDMTNRTFKFAGKVSGEYIEAIDFEELPESVANYIWYSTLVQAYLTDIGLEQIVEQWSNEAQSAEAVATAEHLRNKKFSTRKSPRFIRLRRAMGG